MSRIGKKPISIPNNVKIAITDSFIDVSGPLGNLKMSLRPEIRVDASDNEVILSCFRDSKESFAYLGLTRTLISNMVTGVSQGFEKKLELVGVGYRVKMNGSDLVFSLGFSHPVDVKAPLGIKFEVEGNTGFTVKGIDKCLVGQVASNIRKLRKPEPYKGKGIRYVGEVVRRKAGKSASKGK